MNFPESMEECIYFTNRKLSDGTKIIAFARKKECPKCHKALMGKPKNEKTGKAKIRAKEYVCPECQFTEPKEAHEETLTLEIEYSNSEGTEKKEATAPYKRKTWQGMKAYVFENEFTGQKMGITKRLKEKGERDD